MSYKTNLNATIVDNTTQKEIPIERARLKAQLDDFATFQWRGHDMFEDFGCFIINDKNGSLKFYNGPGFTNQYAKTQFSSSVNGLLGIDFKQQTITMKIGMYWFTIQEYQEFLNEIGPYVINYLTFGYEKEYGYLVKLGKISDSPRHVVGKDKQGQYRYYTELDLTWELLSDSCVRSNLPYEYKRLENETGNSQYTWVFNTEKSDMKDNSLLDTPVFFEIPLSFTDDKAQLQLQAQYGDTEDSIILFDISLQNLTYSNTPTTVTTEEQENLWAQYYNLYQMFLRYDSETGLIYVQEGSNTTWRLLNFQTDNADGNYLLSSGVINKFKIPGKFSQPQLESTQWKFVLTAQGVNSSTGPIAAYETALTVYARKNIV